MKQYLDLLNLILSEGKEIGDRTGVGTVSYRRGVQMKFNLQDGYPLVTTKTVIWRSVVAELLWFLRGSTNVKDLQAMNCHIWDEWAPPNGDLGPTYGHQWRSWMCSPYGPSDQIYGDSFYSVDVDPVDQISTVIDSIQEDPFGRRHVVSAWNPLDIPSCKLPPCHILFQFLVEPGDDGESEFLNCQLYQRSLDAFLGAPFNIASYALLTILIAKQVGLKPGFFTHNIGDAHIYTNHIEQVEKQVKRCPRGLPFVVLEKTPNLKTMTWENNDRIIMSDFWRCKPSTREMFCFGKEQRDENVVLMNYNPMSTIKGDVAV